MAKKSIFKAMQKFISTDESRASLLGFNIELNHEGYEATITATDGHVLCSHTKDLEQLKFEIHEEFNTLPTDFDTLESFQIYPNPKKRPNGKLFETENQYPRYQNIIPRIETMTKLEDLDFYVATNPKMAQICCDAKKYFDMGGASYPFDYAYTKLGACLSQSTDTTIVIMPLRINYN